jgi:hypothetical protein
VPRILAGSTLGSLAAAGGGIVGFLGGLILADCNLEGCSGDSDFLITVPTVLGVGLSSSLTVYGLGESMNGDGYLVAALLGGMLGAGAGVAMAYSGDGTTGVLLTPVLSAVGAVIAYEVSSIDREPEPIQAPEDPYLNLRLTPVFGMTPKGGVLGGLVGQF